MNRAKYFSAMLADFSHDRLGLFLNSITIIPHNFGHQYGSGEFSTYGYRMTGDFEIIFFIGGEGYITVSDNNYICKKGDFVFIPPFVRHSIGTSWENPHDNYWIHFEISPLSLRQKFIDLFAHSNKYLTQVKNYDNLANIYKNLEEEYISGQQGFLALLKASILSVLTHVLKNIDFDLNLLENDKTNSNLQLFADSILAYINENAAEALSVKSICNKFNISKTHLNNIFIKTVGVSPGKMIQHLKLKRAEHVLLTTAMNIDEISDMLGYSSPSYFSNAFKKSYGLSPNMFRKILL